MREMQRRRLLLAFAEVLAEEGLEGAGVGRVCARAGVSRRTFYDLFGGREACFAAVFDATVERVSAAVLPVYRPAGRWCERLREALAVLLELLDDEPALVRVCLLEPLKAGAAVRERRKRVFDALTAAVDAGRGEARGRIEPGPLTAESVTGGAISVVVARCVERPARPLRELLNPLMSMIVHPYLGAAAAKRELERDDPQAARRRTGRMDGRIREPFKDLPIRITFRTARVLTTIAAQAGASNREIGQAAGVADQGQISKLLSRLEGSGLIENRSSGHDSGEPNAWHLTERGNAVQQAIELPAELPGA